MAAGDTFRAGAIEQLEVWGERVGVEVIKHSEGSDPAAVMFDAVQAAKARNADVLLCDTAPPAKQGQFDEGTGKSKACHRTGNPGRPA